MSQRNPFEVDPSRSFQHTGRYGTRLDAQRMDFKSGVVISKPKNITDTHFASDMTEIIGWWVENIKANFPPVHGFSGFDCLNLTVVPGPF